MAKEASLNLIESSHSIGKTIWTLSWPVILDQSFNTMVQYVDSAMVGSLGAVATAAVGSNSSTIWLVNGIMYAFGLAFSVFAARQIGSKDQKAVHHTVRQSLIALMAFSIVVTTIMNSVAYRLPLWIGVDKAVIPQSIDYISTIAKAYPFTITIAFLANLMRSSGDTRSPMMANIITNVANIIGNFFLIYPCRVVSIGNKSLNIWGANLGVKGAAIATAASSALSALILIIILFAKKGPLKTPVFNVDWRVDWPFMKKVFNLGLPLAFERATLNIGQIVLTVLVTKIGTTALASHHLAVTAESVTYMPVSGFAMAATALVAQSLGAQRSDLAKEFAKGTLKWAIVFMSCAGLFLFLFSTQLMRVFTADKEVIALGARVLRIEAFAQPFFAMSIVGGGILRGAGDTKWPFINSVIGMWVVRLFPASILIIFFNASLEVAWMCMVADLIV
ncbi:MAG: MATE family efflux transporter, partial [Sphaerochaetaceae bacterium]